MHVKLLNHHGHSNQQVAAAPGRGEGPSTGPHGSTAPFPPLADSVPAQHTRGDLCPELGLQQSQAPHQLPQAPSGLALLQRGPAAAAAACVGTLLSPSSARDAGEGRTAPSRWS